MKYCFCLVQFLLLIFSLNAQSGNITGKWILDRIVYKEGRRLEVNNAQYSTGLVCIIEQGSIKMNDQKFDATIKLGKIQTPYVTYNYQMEENYLVLYEDKSDKFSFFLRPKDFIERYPEFIPLKTVINDDSVTIANELTDYEFKSDVSLDEFIRKRMTDRPSKSFKNLYFRASFVLTKNNKVTSLQILNSISSEYDNEYLAALKAAEPFFSNHTGTDILITREVSHLMLYKELKNPEEKKLYDLLATGDDYYYQNKFDKAVEAYSKIANLSIENNRYKLTIKHAMIRLGIAYLALGNNEQACATFKLAGNNTDFQLRHYINDFCAPASEADKL